MTAVTADGARDGFAAALAAVTGVEGWMSDGQARRLWDRAAELRAPALAVEIGSYRGRSAIVLARAAQPGVTVIAIDPHAGNDRGPQEIHGTVAEGDADHAAFHANLARAGVSDAVRHVRRPSRDALDEVSGAIDLLYVDGAHRYGPAREDIRRWGARVAPEGTLLVHDSFSSIGVTLALARLLFASRQWAYVGRERSLAEYRRIATPGLRGVDRARNLLAQLAQVPWFARNVTIKIALVGHLRPLAALLGHRSGDWPY